MAASTKAAAEAKTSVWWDIDWCAVPPGCCDPHRIAHNIIAALATAGCKGPVSVFAYGDASRIAPDVLEALSSTGICLNHVSAGAKDGVDKKMLVDMVFWAYDNPPPGNYLLISGDQDFSDLLHKLEDEEIRNPTRAAYRCIVSRTCYRSKDCLGLGVSSNGHYHQIYQQSKSSKAYTGEIFEKGGNESKVKPLQKYVKKITTACSSSKQVDSIRTYDCSVSSTRSEVHLSSVLSSSSSKSVEGTKVGYAGPPGTSILFQSSAKNPTASVHSHQVRAP